MNMTCMYPGCRDEQATSGLCHRHWGIRKYRDFAMENAGKFKSKEGRAAIYVIGSEHLAPLKIGYSVSPSERRDMMQTGFPHPMRIYYAKFGPIGAVQALERLVHRVLKEFGFHLHGEWFETDVAESIEVIEKLSLDYDLPLTDADGLLTMMEEDRLRGIPQDERAKGAIERARLDLMATKAVDSRVQ